MVCTFSKKTNKCKDYIINARTFISISNDITYYKLVDSKSFMHI